VLLSVSIVEDQLGVKDKPVVMAEPGDPDRVEVDSGGHKDAID
jgi:hypothetical protein